jgi:hypothetical protein
VTAGPLTSDCETTVPSESLAYPRRTTGEQVANPWPVPNGYLMGT